MSYILFFLMGLNFGLIGAGGSILSMPILIYYLSINPVMAVSYSFYIVGIVAVIGAIGYVYKKNVNIKDVLYFSIPSSVGVGIARYIILPLITNQNIVIILFSIFMIVSSVITFFKKDSIVIQKIKPLKAIISAILIGLISGTLGAGGGFLIIPALYNFLNVDIKRAIGTSLSIVAINCFVAIAMDFSKQTAIDFKILLPIIIFAIIGMMFGILLSEKISNKNMKTGFSIFTLIIGFWMLFRQIYG